MLKRDVTKSIVIISITMSIATVFASTSPASFLPSARVSPSLSTWGWENTTVVVNQDILIEKGETFKIRNSTVEMDSSEGTIGIRVLGHLLVTDSTIKSIDDEGYYFEIFGAAEIENSRIEGIKSIDPIGEGMIVSPLLFRLRGSTLSAYENHAITFYFPHINAEDFVVDSHVQGVVLVKTYLNVKNSTLGDLSFSQGPSEVHLFNSSYTRAQASMSAFGYIHSWRFLQVHTSLPEADLTIMSADDRMVDRVRTDEDGRFSAWWLSTWTIVDPNNRDFTIDNNPFTFEAEKTVIRHSPQAILEGHRIIAFVQEYYGRTVQDLEENAMIEIELVPFLQFSPPKKPELDPYPVEVN